MVCKASQNNINIPSPGQSPSIPGLGLPISIPKLPFPDVSVLESAPEALQDLVRTIIARLPSGIKLIPDTTSAMKGVWDAVSNLLTKIAPFLALYSFFQALLNIILCIIDVICALMNPWALRKAVKRLFKQCLPDFLSLFPWAALVVMILSLLLLLMAIIEYLIEVISSYINQILDNIKILIRAIQVNDADAVIAATNKIAYLLCLFEQLFTILSTFALLFEIVKKLMEMSGRGVCSKGSGGSCCDDDFCPTFISSNPNGLFNHTGKLIYQSKVDVLWPTDGSMDFLKNSGITPQREERWQFVDVASGVYSFDDIITPSPELGFTYWPEGEEFASDANVNKVPYLLDMSFYINPRAIGQTSDYKGQRQFFIQNVIVKKRPTHSPISWNNGTDTSATDGSLYLGGGLVYEYTDDGYSAYMVNGSQATLETFISMDRNLTSIPVTDDGYYIWNIDYNLRFNHSCLIDKRLISLMCAPDTSTEAAVINAEYSDLRSLTDRMGSLPDINATITCLNDSLSSFRKNINNETAAIFQSETTACLNNLKDQANTTYTAGVAIAADRFKSSFTINPDLQFIRSDIVVTIVLRDKSGSPIVTNASQEIGSTIAKTLKIEPSLGEGSELTYDGYESFTGTIRSNVAGIGTVKAYVNNEVFASVINRDNIDASTEIIEQILEYEFVDHAVPTYRRDQGDEFKIRFDNSNIAEDN